MNAEDSISKGASIEENVEQNFIALPAGVIIRNYRLLRSLGQGGFGITYLAEEEASGQHVVIKENLPAAYSYRHPQDYTIGPASTSMVADYNWAKERFIEEAQLLARLDHPNIVKVFGAFEALGTAYYVMPHINGQELGKSAPPPAEINEQWLSPIVHTMLGALEYLHAQGIYHRDVKPGNIMLREDGTPVLIDFGAARAMVGERSATMIESAGYTPIEQVQSSGKIGPWTDLYALGAMCYRLIIGERPPRSVNRMSKNDPYIPLAPRKELRGRFSQAFLKGIDRALSVWPEDRWQSAADWRATLPANQAPAGGGSPSPTPAQRPTRGYVVLPWCLCTVLFLGMSSILGFHISESTSLDETFSLRNQNLTEKRREADQQRKETEKQIHATTQQQKETEEKLAAAASQLEQARQEAARLNAALEELKNASGYGREEARRKLKEKGIDESRYAHEMEYAYNKPELLGLLIAAGVDVNTVDEYGATTLYWTASNIGTVECMKLLLAAPGIDVNKANNNGWTPLFKAIADNSNPTERVRLLLAAPGIDVNKPNKDGQTPLSIAEKKGLTECVRLLRNAGAR